MDFAFSIIIPHHNIPTLLERCIKTIPFRTDTEVIVIDDGSDSLYLNELRRIDECYNIKIIYNKHSGGGGKARNIGLESASGKYLIFADADDFFYGGFDKLLDRHFLSNDDIIFFNVKSYMKLIYKFLLQYY